MDEHEPKDVAPGEDAPPGGLASRHRTRGAVALVVALLLVIGLLGVIGPVGRLEGTSRITMFVLGALGRDHDVVIRNVEVAHEHLNMGVWGSVPPDAARSRACDRLDEAAAHASRSEYDPVEVGEIEAVAELGCADQIELRDFHDTVRGLEAYLRGGQGRHRTSRWSPR